MPEGLRVRRVRKINHKFSTRRVCELGICSVQLLQINSNLLLGRSISIKKNGCWLSDDGEKSDGGSDGSDNEGRGGEKIKWLGNLCEREIVGKGERVCCGEVRDDLATA